MFRYQVLNSTGFYLFKKKATAKAKTFESQEAGKLQGPSHNNNDDKLRILLGNAKLYRK